MLGENLTSDGPGRGIVDVAGLVTQRYAGCPGVFYLFRPDQHVCARWRALDAEAVHRALSRAVGQPEDQRSESHETEAIDC